MCDLSSLVNYFMGSFAPEVIPLKGHKYTVVKQLGKGGFSVVYLVENKNKKHYALKRMTVPDRKERERALREVEILKSFDHPNIVKMYDFETMPSSVAASGSDILILLEFFANGTFQDLIEKEKSPIAESTLLKIFMGTCLAVQQLHESKPALAHRDLKPANILLGPGGEPVLTDFGSAGEAVISPKQLMQMKGQLQEDANETTTESYCPPELYDYGGILDDNKVDQRVDIWSLGCLLYCGAFKINPFDNEVLRGGSLRLAINNGKISFPDSHRYSPGFIQLISNTIVVNADKRPWIHELIKMTQQVIDGETIAKTNDQSELESF